MHIHRIAPRVGSFPLVRIAIGSDHAGYELKEAAGPFAAGRRARAVDVGADSQESVDYPEPAAEAARMVGEGEAERAVIVCGSGVGVSIVANKVDGVRAVNAHDAEEAEMSRRHNDVNVLTLAGRRLDAAAAEPIVDSFPEHRIRGRPPRAPGGEDRRARDRTPPVTAS